MLFGAVLILSGHLKVRLQSSSGPVPTDPLIREEQKVVVDGIAEIWRLEWKSPPVPACGTEDLLSAITCPCSGFSFGESGQLNLVRFVGEREIDRFELTRLFEKEYPSQDGAVVQRWELQEEDFQQYETPEAGHTERVRARPAVKIMHFADFNHDGRATEFFLQTEVLPCGKRTGVLVGVTPRNSRLHAFGSIAHPKKPLVLQKREWESLLKAPGPTRVVDWRCGDHGSEIETDLELRATKRGIEAILWYFECNETGSRGRLLRKETL